MGRDERKSGMSNQSPQNTANPNSDRRGWMREWVNGEKGKWGEGEMRRWGEGEMRKVDFILSLEGGEPARVDRMNSLAVCSDGATPNPIQKIRRFCKF